MPLSWSNWISELKGVATAPTANESLTASSQTKPYTVGAVSTVRQKSTLQAGSTYCLGGFATTFAQQSDKLNMATDAVAVNQASSLLIQQDRCASVSNAADSGYVIAGGTLPATVTNTAVAQKITYSTDVCSLVATANASVARRSLMGLNCSTYKAYMLGGYTNTQVVTADRLTFSTELTAAVAGANLSAARWGAASVAGGHGAGYVVGGRDAADKNTGDKVTYATDTTAACATANTTAARREFGGTVTNLNSYAYVMGGVEGSTVKQTCDRITLSTDTTAAYAGANLVTAKQKGEPQGGSCRNLAGYVFAGTASSAGSKDVQKLKFSTETCATSTALLKEGANDVAVLSSGSL